MRKSIRTSKSYFIEGKLVKKGTRIILEEFEDLGSAPNVDPEMEDIYTMRRKKRLGRFSRMDVPSDDMEAVGEEAMETDSPVETMRRARMAKLRRLRRACKKAEDTSDDMEDVEDVEDTNDVEDTESEVKAMRRMARMRRMRRVRRLNRR